MLDAMIDRPLSQILVEMNVSAPITEALLNRPQANNPYSLILRLVQNYESATWEVVGELALQLGLEDGTVVLLYLDALRWSTDLFRDLPVAVPASVR
jgi:c-di-GMP-related signal transduction protein